MEKTTRTYTTAPYGQALYSAAETAAHIYTTLTTHTHTHVVSYHHGCWPFTWSDKQWVTSYIIWKGGTCYCPTFYATGKGGSCHFVTVKRGSCHFVTVKGGSYHFVTATEAATISLRQGRQLPFCGCQRRQLPFHYGKGRRQQPATMLLVG